MNFKNGHSLYLRLGLLNFHKSYGGLFIYSTGIKILLVYEKDRAQEKQVITWHSFIRINIILVWACIGICSHREVRTALEERAERRKCFQKLYWIVSIFLWYSKFESIMMDSKSLQKKKKLDMSLISPFLIFKLICVFNYVLKKSSLCTLIFSRQCTFHRRQKFVEF